MGQVLALLCLSRIRNLTSFIFRSVSTVLVGLGSRVWLVLVVQKDLVAIQEFKFVCMIPEKKMNCARWDSAVGLA